MATKTAINPVENARPKSKAYNEAFAKFFEAPSREGLREFLQTNHGELRECDFKAEWPEGSAIARHILGLANSGGGCLIAGVAERDDGSLDPVGMTALTDKAKLTNSVKGYLPNSLLSHFDVLDFSYQASEYPGLVGKRFQVLLVEAPSHLLPFVAARDGKSVRQAAIYLRREGVTEEATYGDLQRLINTRVASGRPSRAELEIRHHLDQLKQLYASISRTNAIDLSNLVAQIGLPRVKNTRYPVQDFDDFVADLIERKKKRIAEELDL